MIASTVPSCRRSALGIVWFVYGLVIFVTYLSVADQALGKAELLPLPATVGGVVMLIPFFVRALVIDLWQQRSTQVMKPLVENKAPILLFALIAFWSLLLSLLPGAYWEEDSKWIFLIVYGLAMSLCALFVPLQPTVRSALPLYTFLALVALLASMVYDLVHPGTFSTELTRAAGFPGNSNYSALIAVFLCASALDYDARRAVWIDLAFLTVTALAILATMSRSGMVHFSALSMFYFYHRFIHGGVRLREMMRLTFGLVVATVALMATLPVFLSDLTVFQSSTRLGRFLSNEQVDDGSAASRFGAVMDSLRLINDSPVVGHGTAHSRTMDELPHNLYLMQWVNNGLPGLLSYIGFLMISYLTFKKRRFRAGQAFILVAALGSTFSHNVLDQRPFLILWGILMTRSLLAERVAVHKKRSARIESRAVYEYSTGEPSSWSGFVRDRSLHGRAPV